MKLNGTRVNGLHFVSEATAQGHIDALREGPRDKLQRRVEQLERLLGGLDEEAVSRIRGPHPVVPREVAPVVAEPEPAGAPPKRTSAPDAPAPGAPVTGSKRIRVRKERGPLITVRRQPGPPPPPDDDEGPSAA